MNVSDEEEESQAIIDALSDSPIVLARYNDDLVDSTKKDEIIKKKRKPTEPVEFRLLQDYSRRQACIKAAVKEKSIKELENLRDFPHVNNNSTELVGKRNGTVFDRLSKVVSKKSLIDKMDDETVNNDFYPTINSYSESLIRGVEEKFRWEEDKKKRIMDLKYEYELKLASQVTGAPILNPLSRKIVIESGKRPTGIPIENILLDSHIYPLKEEVEIPYSWNQTITSSKEENIMSHEDLTSIASGRLYKDAERKMQRMREEERDKKIFEFFDHESGEPLFHPKITPLAQKQRFIREKENENVFEKLSKPIIRETLEEPVKYGVPQVNLYSKLLVSLKREEKSNTRLYDRLANETIGKNISKDNQFTFKPMINKRSETLDACRRLRGMKRVECLFRKKEIYNARLKCLTMKDSHIDPYLEDFLNN